MRDKTTQKHDERAAKARRAFEAKAIVDAALRLGVPRDWWGDWRNVYGPGGQSVHFSRTCGGVWRVCLDGLEVSATELRRVAIRRAKQLKRGT